MSKKYNIINIPYISILYGCNNASQDKADTIGTNKLDIYSR